MMALGFLLYLYFCAAFFLKKNHTEKRAQGQAPFFAVIIVTLGPAAHTPHGPSRAKPLRCLWPFS